LVAKRADGEKAWFAIGQPWRFLDVQEGKHLDCVDEVEAVLGEVGQALGFIPFEFHRMQLHM